jgi:hypothetical protein
MSDTDTIGVEIEVAAVEPMRGCGSLHALAVVTMRIYDVEISLLGVQIRRERDGLHVRPPEFRYKGQWVPCIQLPPELRDALRDEVLAFAMEMTP